MGWYAAIRCSNKPGVVRFILVSSLVCSLSTELFGYAVVDVCTVSGFECFEALQGSVSFFHLEQSQKIPFFTWDEFSPCFFGGLADSDRFRPFPQSIAANFFRRPTAPPDRIHGSSYEESSNDNYTLRKLTWNPKMEGGRWVSFSIGWFLGVMLNFWGVCFLRLVNCSKLDQILQVR